MWVWGPDTQLTWAPLRLCGLGCVTSYRAAGQVLAPASDAATVMLSGWRWVGIHSRARPSALGQGKSTGISQSAPRSEG